SAPKENALVAQHQPAESSWARALSSGDASSDAIKRAPLPRREDRVASRSEEEDDTTAAPLVRPRMPPAAAPSWRWAGGLATTTTCSDQSRSSAPTNFWINAEIALGPVTTRRSAAPTEGAENSASSSSQE